MTISNAKLPVPVIAADVGNARIKLGLFAGDYAAGLPEPLQTLPLLGDEPELDQIEPWLEGNVSGTRRVPDPLPAHGVCGIQWWIASVNRPAATRLIDWLKRHRPTDRVTLLAAGDLPLEVRLERPDMVGIDRLVDAVAVNRLRDAGRPAVDRRRRHGHHSRSGVGRRGLFGRGHPARHSDGSQGTQPLHRPAASGRRIGTGRAAARLGNGNGSSHCGRVVLGRRRRDPAIDRTTP